jgi:ubiquitin C-terminal hydrolase
LKDFFIRVNSSHDERIKFLFELLAYPNDKIAKKHLVRLISNPNENAIKGIDDDIDLSLFIDISVQTSVFFEIINLLNRIIYIPFIYFKLRPDDLETEKKCTEIMMKGEKDIKAYLCGVLDTSDVFYCVDIDFWNSVSAGRDLEKGSRRPIINFTNLTGEFEGQLKGDLQLCKDFVIIPERLYELLIRWYQSAGSEIKVSKIIFTSSESDDSSTIRRREGDHITEIELHPIYAKHIQFEEVIKYITDNTIEKVVDYIKLMYEVRLKNINRLSQYSRKYTFQTVKESLEKYYMVANVKTKIWLYYQGRLYQPDCNKTLEEEGVKDYCIFMLEVMSNNIWLSESFKNSGISKSNEVSIADNSSIKVGIKNIGNTCYMNSVLQILLNLKEINQIFLSSKFDKFIHNGKIVAEFIKLLNEKWDEKKSHLTPVKFKEIIGDMNSQFKFNDQQDAQEFFNFLIDTLHEEINLKETKEYIANPERYDGTDAQLANEYWANNLRRNASFIHSLFLGQLKSNLICSKCETNKITFETFTSLNMPIPQKRTINLDIILHRLPFVFKMYYLDNYSGKNVTQNIDIRNSMNLLRKKSIEKYLENHEEEEDLNSTGISTTTFDKLYAYRSSTSIPIKVVIEIDRKHKVNSVIERLKEIKELELETDSKMSDYAIMASEGTFIDKNLTIDECFQPFQTITVYELLNTNGIYKYLHNDDVNILVQPPETDLFEKNTKSIYKLSSDTCVNFNKPIHLEKVLTNVKSEYLIQITHRYAVEAKEYLFRRQTFSRTDHLYSVILVNNKVSNGYNLLDEFQCQVSIRLYMGKV